MLVDLGHKPLQYSDEVHSHENAFGALLAHLLASLCAFFISQMYDVAIFQLFKTYYE